MATLYTPEMLAAATGLAAYPLTDDLPLRGAARSQTCGSTLTLGLALTDGRISAIGMQPRACAVGQAAAWLFAKGAPGRTPADIARDRDRIVRWLADPQAPVPDWPDWDLIAPARDRPGRHGAILLAWDAAIDALAAID